MGLKKIARGAMFAVLATFAVGTTTTASAATLEIDASNSGWYNTNGYANGTAGNTCTGCGSLDYHAWLGFDLSGVTDTIVSATLSIFNHASNHSGAIVTLSDVTTSYSLLGTSSTAIHTDLGDGTVYGSATTTAGVYNDFVLNGDALAALNATTGFWAVGMSSNNIGLNSFGYNRGVGDNPDYYRLQISTVAPVPLPAAMPMLIAGIAGLGFAGRRRAKKASA